MSPKPRHPDRDRSVPGGTPVSRELLLSRLSIVPTVPAPEPSPGEIELSVVIVNYRSRQVLIECLASLDVDTGGIRRETFVVDNDPSDGTLDVLTKTFPRIRGMANPENVGFARAVNQGIAATTGDYVLLLNPDCFVERGTVGALMGYLRTHPRTAIVGPRLVGREGKLQYSARSFPDHFTFLFNRYSLLTRLFPSNPFSRRYLLSDWDHASVRAVDWVSGACMMVRRAAIAEVGPMDEAYFMFNEDVDWCRRMKQAGWEVVFVPEGVVRHDIGASRRKVATKVIVERHRGMIHYFHKHHPTHPVVAFIADTAIRARGLMMLLLNALRPR